MNKHIKLVFKGIGMGAANVIPGVSGGTVALITGIYEKLIDSVKSFNIAAAKLLFTGKFREFADHVNLGFLIVLFTGVGIGIFSLARLLKYLFINYPICIWAFFFGLILGSVYFVARRINKWSAGTIAMFVLGAIIAIGISVVNPASENDAIWYLFICGVVAMCSMILPGLSGSFVLILMGNYQLVMLDAVSNFNLRILIPLGLGAAAGLIAFSNFISWIFKKFRNQTIALMTGFILGSLAMLWPWKRSLDIDGNAIATNRFGAFIDEAGGVVHGIKVFGYRQIMPESFDVVAAAAIALALLGIASIWLIEKSAKEDIY